MNEGVAPLSSAVRRAILERLLVRTPWEDVLKILKMSSSSHCKGKFIKKLTNFDVNHSKKMKKIARSLRSQNFLSINK